MQTRGLYYQSHLMEFLSRLLSFLLCLAVSFFSYYSQAQGGELLIQQYNQGPVLDNFYSRWSINLGIQLNRINTDKENTNPKITLGSLIQLEYNVSKTVGFISGLNYTPISYSYTIKDSLGQDNLKYFSIPIGIRLNPTKRVSISLGGLYNRYQKGEYEVSLNDFARQANYAESIFKNSLGGFAQIGYHFFKRFYGFLNFRWATRNSSPTLSQSNNTSGFQVGFVYQLWSSRVKR